MSKTYVIQWKSKVNGRIGKGTKLFDREEAYQLVQELNSEYPQIEHEMVETSEAAGHIQSLNDQSSNAQKEEAPGPIEALAA